MDFGLARTAAQSQSAHTDVRPKHWERSARPNTWRRSNSRAAPLLRDGHLRARNRDLRDGHRKPAVSRPDAFRCCRPAPARGSSIPRQLMPGLDPRWEKTILRCLSRRPEERFQNTSDVLLLFRPRRNREAPRRWKWLTAIAAALVILASRGAGCWCFALQATFDRAPGMAATHQFQRGRHGSGAFARRPNAGVQTGRILVHETPDRST
jgi:hypothetical protein